MRSRCRTAGTTSTPGCDLEVRAWRDIGGGGASKRDAADARALAGPRCRERGPAGSGARQFRHSARDRRRTNPAARRRRSRRPRESVAHRDRVAPLLRSMRSLQWLSLGLVVLLSGAAAAAVVLAARGALDTHRFMIEVMHGIGATDLQLTHLFQRKIAIDSLVGSIVGAVAGALVILLLASGASFTGNLIGGASLAAGDWSSSSCCLSRSPRSRPGLPGWLSSRHCATHYDLPRRVAHHCCSTQSASSCSPSRSARPRRRRSADRCRGRAHRRERSH